jgi:ubiquinone/menaquinone biosynthesis C-methylase UbiE
MPTFDERAATWDTPERVERAAQVAVAIRAAVSIPKDARAIEVGAGTGLLGLNLLDALDELVLADTSPGMLEVAEEKIRRAGLSNVRTASFDLAGDPAPDGAPFDLVVSLLVLHHVEDTATALASIRGLLRPGGQLAMADLDTEDGSFHSPDAEGIHHRGFDRDALAALARDAGFEEIRFSTASVLRGESRSYPLFLLTATAA